MQTINIICIDDQLEVLDSVVRDLKYFEDFFSIEECTSVDEALELIEELDAKGQHIALVISDHIMPKKHGVEFLGQLAKDHRFLATKKILLTGQATQSDTINAINDANIDHYFEKPWQKENLIAKVKTLLTEYIVEKGLDYQKIIKALDQEVLYKKLHP